MRKPRRKLLWTALLAMTLAASPLPGAHGPAFAAGTGTEIHVGLFMKTDGYVSAEEAVTLSSDTGLRVTDPSGKEWLRAAAAEFLQASIDGYRVIVTDTSDAAAADSLAAAVTTRGQPLYGVFTYSVNGKTMYRVEAGPYATGSEAETARLSLAPAGKLAGPYHALAGIYDSEASALTAAASLWDAGIYAAPALTVNDAGAVTYALLAGAATNADALDAIIAASGGTLTPLPADKPYALLRTTVGGWKHVAVGGAEGKLIFAPAAADGAVRVAERSNRTYRGAIDIFAHNGALAVVNRVDLEDYVASVVGSELNDTWPAETLKAQAVATRTYALKQGWKYGIANVTDTTADQAYYGVEREAASIVAAAKATAGERLVLADGTLLDAFYHSNAGDRTADPFESWGFPVAGITSVPSPDDAAERNKLTWYRIVTPDRQIGYVRSDLVSVTGGVNAGGFRTAVITGSGVNIREAPYVNNDTNPAIAQLNQGAKVTIIGEDIESTSYRWVRGPFTGSELLAKLQSSSAAPESAAAIPAIYTASVTKRSTESGRVLEVSVNGTPLQAQRSDHYRNMFSLPSNRFEIEETAKVTVLGAQGRKTELPTAAGTSQLAVAGAGGAVSSITQGAYLIADGSGDARVATAAPEFRIHGTGNGHGLGMSQWGAFGLAELGYGYREILQYYYKDATIVKD